MVCSMRQNKAGFTLIEILVSVSIGALLVGGGIASYNNFNDKQQVVSGARGLIVTFRNAQKRALSGDKTSACSTLAGWRVNRISLTQYRLLILCGDGSRSTIETKSLPVGVEFVNNFVVDFAVLTGGVSGDGSIQLQNTGGGNVFTVSVTDGGAIEEVGFEN